MVPARGYYKVTNIMPSQLFTRTIPIYIPCTPQSSTRLSWSDTIIVIRSRPSLKDPCDPEALLQ